jgi:DNA-binding HxlR family transcriptional regulator
MVKFKQGVCNQFHEAIELIGARWSGAIIQVLITDNHRFGDIKTAIPGISDTMLAQRLQDLEAAEVIERRAVSDDGPLRHEYFLTSKGLELKPIMDAVGSWAHKWSSTADGHTDDD